MPTNTLTDADCRRAKPAEKALKLFDGGGMHLWVSPAGAKVWRVAYRLDGKPKTKSLGAYPELSLADARKKRDELKAELREGADPMAAKKAKRAKAGVTFKSACETYWAGRGDVSEGYRDNALRALEKHLWPVLGADEIGSIDRERLLMALNRMNDAKLYEFVRKVRMWAGQVFDWAVEQGTAKINPAALIKTEKAFGKSKVQSFAALTLPEMPAFCERLALENEIQSVLACKMLALTWVRTAELRLMTWDEVDGDLWRIPKERMKRDYDHLVPLSSQALDLLKVMKARCRGSVYVFPADHRPDRAMSENSVLYLLYRMGYKGKMTGHGFRSVASTWANERGYGEDAIERQLSHVPGDRVRAIYNRAAYLPQRRQMLQDFADWMDSLTAG